YPWAVTPAYLDRITPKDMAKDLDAAARAFSEWDANSLVLRFAAYRAHDVGAPFEGDMRAALKRLTMPALLLVSAGDRLIGADGARRIRDLIAHPTYAEIPGDLGHRSVRAPPGTPAGDFIAAQIRSFLAGPGHTGEK